MKLFTIFLTLMSLQLRANDNERLFSVLQDWFSKVPYEVLDSKKAIADMLLTKETLEERSYHGLCLDIEAVGSCDNLLEKPLKVEPEDTVGTVKDKIKALGIFKEDDILHLYMGHEYEYEKRLNIGKTLKELGLESGRYVLSVELDLSVEKFFDGFISLVQNTEVLESNRDELSSETRSKLADCTKQLYEILENDPCGLDGQVKHSQELSPGGIKSQRCGEYYEKLSPQLANLLRELGFSVTKIGSSQDLLFSLLIKWESEKPNGTPSDYNGSSSSDEE